MDKMQQGLNPQQQKAVLATEGPVLIVAGAGAGKTKTITHRIGHLIEKGVAPDAILAITFTNKAAKEMRERVLQMLGREHVPTFNRGANIPWVSTFHALGIAILREHGTAIGIAKGATIIDQDDAKKLIKEALKAQSLDPKEHDPAKILGAISRHKGNMGTAETIAATVRDHFRGQLYERTMKLYEQSLRKANALDFDDLLEKTVRLLQTHPEIRAYYNRKWQYIHVDEYQDTNAVQYTLTQLLAGERRNICVVGDSDQSIYSWRGASIANILDFEKDYPNAQVILLEQNYRSTKNILQAANSVIEKNELRKDKVLFTENNEGEKLTIIEGFDEIDEARRIAQKIAALMGSGIKASDIAILYRTNVQSRVLEEAMLFAGIPYQVLGTRFYDRKEVKDALAYLRAALNPENKLDLTRIINVPARGIGEKTLEKVLSNEVHLLSNAMQVKVKKFYDILERIRAAALVQKPSQLLMTVIEESGIGNMLKTGDDEDIERLGNVLELVTVAKRYDIFDGTEGITQYLEDLALESDQDRMSNADAVRLMTVHASKGLEFDYVFVTGMEQDLFPSNKMREHDSPEAQEEERRLFYVALTRAAKKVFLSHAAMRTIFGSRNYTLPSEFLDDIDESLIERETPPKLEQPKRKFSLLDDPFDDDVFQW
ncbi:MAG TPA: UvrD-helicase domain-containing protein [Candidatus Paceibacterota bacterium]|nr:UvrD-helicase domain-containing protein [Candidatus Paceibacterota bacterium]